MKALSEVWREEGVQQGLFQDMQNEKMLITTLKIAKIKKLKI